MKSIHKTFSQRLRFLGRKVKASYLLTFAWSACFTVAAFMFMPIVGVVVLGVMFLLVELRVDD